MKSLILFGVLVVLGIAHSLPEGADPRASSSVTTGDLVKKHGYPFEQFKVQTSDGYILTIHRIPYSSKLNNQYEKKPVAFLMHGLLCSSSDWVLNGPESGLAYILSDAGYDVWLGNARGNTYSRAHATMNPDGLFTDFWTFDWNEIGLYDLPAMIDYVLFYTDVEQVRYFGHSQGTTSYFVLNSMIPRFKNRIRSAHLLAPVAYMEHMESPLAKVAAPLMGQPNMLVELFGSTEFLPSSRAMELLGQIACQDASFTQIMCTNVLFLLGGWDSPYLNTTMIPEIMSTTPAGCSVNQMLHYLQEYNSGYYRQFDYGSVRNNIEYNSKNPPIYDLDKIGVPTFLYYSDNDYFASLVDVHRLIQEMDPSALKGAYRMPQKKWNHLDFLWGLNVKEYLYDFIMDDVNNS